MMTREAGIRMSFSEELQPAKIKVIGVGGGGCNAGNPRIRAKLEGVEFITAKTKLQALKLSQTPAKPQPPPKPPQGPRPPPNPHYAPQAPPNTPPPHTHTTQAH